MSMLAMTLPWRHATPLYTPRRDLVADASDSLSLTVTLMEDDTPDAPPADLVTGPTFPGFTLAITTTRECHGWDYGSMMPVIGSVLWSGAGVIDATLPGTVDFSVPLGTMAAFPRRCAWAVRVAHDATRQDTLCRGILNVSGQTWSAAPDSGGGGNMISSDSMAVWFSTLPTTLPPTPGLPWNDGGVLAFS